LQGTGHLGAANCLTKSRAAPSESFENLRQKYTGPLSRAGISHFSVIYAAMRSFLLLGERFERAVSIMARLRAPGGCPWDREQTFDTIKPYTLEEAYEVVEAIDARDWDELTGDLGDLLLQVLFYSEMAAEEERFSIDDVLDRLSNKLVIVTLTFLAMLRPTRPARSAQLAGAEGRRKKKRQPETGDDGAKKEDHPESVLAGVSSAMPSLMEAYKISSRVAHVGFDWPNIEGLFDKLNEETEELRQNLQIIRRLVRSRNRPLV
jgi:MazG family protein